MDAQETASDFSQAIISCYKYNLLEQNQQVLSTLARYFEVGIMTTQLMQDFPELANLSYVCEFTSTPKLTIILVERI